MNALRFVVPGEPIVKGRARSAIMKKRDGSSFIRTYTPGETRAYEAKVKTIAALEANKARWETCKTDRFSVRVSIYRTHEGKGGDGDNYYKALGDAMNGIAYPDDRYVREILIRIRQDPSNPRVHVTVIRAKIGELFE